MSFLTPLFLIGLTALALPIIFHLIRKTTRDRFQFSSLLFLQPTPPRVTRRSRPHNILLLLLRCAVLSLIAFAFARPFLTGSAGPLVPQGRQERVVLLLDTSASMRRQGLWPQLQEKAAELVNRISEGNELAIYTFDRSLQPVLPFEEWNSTSGPNRKQLAAQKIAGLNPQWTGTDLGQALIQTAELLEASAPTGSNSVVRKIHVLSDLQEGSRIEGVQGYRWPKNLQFVFTSLRPKNTGNAGLQWIAAHDSQAKGIAPGKLRVINAADSRQEQFEIVGLRTNGVRSNPVRVFIPAGQSKTVAWPDKNSDSSFQQFQLNGDSEPFDNSAFLNPPALQRIPLLVVGSENPKDPTGSIYFFLRALQETAREKFEVEVVPPNKSGEVEWDRYQAAFVFDSLPEPAISKGRQFLQGQKKVFMVMTDARMAGSIGLLAGSDSIRAEEAPISNYSMLTQIDFQHPLFLPFAEPRYGDFTRIHFWKHRKLTVPETVKHQIIARYDSRQPAVVQLFTTNSSLIVFTSSWKPADSQLALSSKFVPLLYSALEMAVGGRSPSTHYFVGDRIALAGFEGKPADDSITVTRPDGSGATLPASSSLTATEPGIYTVAGRHRIAVNVPLEESRTAPLDPARFATLGIPLEAGSSPEVSTPHSAEILQKTELESRQKLWRWLIIFALVVLMGETWLAGRLSNKAANPVAAQ